MKKLNINHHSRVFPTSNKPMSPIIKNLNHSANSKDCVISNINGTDDYDISFYHFGGLAMLLKRLFAKSKIHVVVFHGTDLHRFNKDLSFLNRIKEYLNWVSNKLLMKYCDEIMIVSKSLFEFIPDKFKLKTSILFLGVDKINSYSNIFKKNSSKTIAFVNNNLRGVKNKKLAETFSLKNELILKELNGLKYKDFLKELNSSNYLIITSFKEGSPNVVKEALVLGTEVITVDVGDCKSLIERFGGTLINYSGIVEKKFEAQNNSYNEDYLSINRSINMIKNIVND